MKFAEKGIYTLLSGLAGGRVYALRAPDKAPAPFIIFQRTDSDRWDSMNEASGVVQATIQIDVYAGEFYEAKNLAGSVEMILNKYRGTVEGIRIAGISLQNDIDLLDTDEPVLFRNSASYLITYYQD